MKNCPICGYGKKCLIECKRCGKAVCFMDFVITHSLCVDCFIMEFNEKYQNAFSEYARGFTA